MVRHAFLTNEFDAATSILPRLLVRQFQDASFSWIDYICRFAFAGDNTARAFGSRNSRFQMKFSVIVHFSGLFGPANNRCCPDPDRL